MVFVVGKSGGSPKGAPLEPVGPALLVGRQSPQQVLP